MSTGWTTTPPLAAETWRLRRLGQREQETLPFAVYNDQNTMLFQVQAVPDHPTDIVHTFDEPGRYQVVCLEFCGVGHHKMVGTLVVKP